MAEPLSLLEFLQALATVDDVRAAFAADPAGTLADHGLDELSPADVHDALVLVEDVRTADFTHDRATAAGDPAQAPPPPSPHDGSGHQAAVEYLSRYLGGERGTPADPWAEDDPDPDPDRWIDLDATTTAVGPGAAPAGGATTGSSSVTGHHTPVDTGATAYGTGSTGDVGSEAARHDPWTHEVASETEDGALGAGTPGRPDGWAGSDGSDLGSDLGGDFGGDFGYGSGYGYGSAESGDDEAAVADDGAAAWSDPAAADPSRPDPDF